MRGHENCQQQAKRKGQLLVDYGGFKHCRTGLPKSLILVNPCDRFIDFVKKSQREKAFLQACRLQALVCLSAETAASAELTFLSVIIAEDKQQIVKGLVTDLLQRWSIEEQNEQLRRGQAT